MFGLLRDVHVVGLLWERSGEFESLYDILHHFRAVSRWRFFHVDSSKEVLGREREDQVLQQCESYLTQMRKGSNDAHQVTARESEILDLLRLEHPIRKLQNIFVSE